MTRRGKGPLIPVLNAHNQEVLRILGVPSGRDRTLTAAQTRKADPVADKPKKVTGGLRGGDALKNTLAVLEAQGIVIDQTDAGMNYGDQLENPVIVNANSPLFSNKTAGASDTPSTTNTVSTVIALDDEIVLGDGFWTVRVDGEVVLTHSAGATAGVSVDIEGDESTLRQVATVPATGGVRCAASHLVVGLIGPQTINFRIRFRSVTAGTTAARNPSLSAVAWRTSP